MASEFECAEQVGHHEVRRSAEKYGDDDHDDDGQCDGDENYVLVQHCHSSWLRNFSLQLHDKLLIASLLALLLGMAGTTTWCFFDRVVPWVLGMLPFCGHVLMLVAYVCQCRVGDLLAALVGYVTIQWLGLGQAAYYHAVHFVDRRRQQSFILQKLSLFWESLASSREQQLQAVAIFASLLLTALPVLDVYSAVALFAPPRDGGRCSCWEALHGPAFNLFGARYIAASMPMVLRVHNTDGGWWMSVLQDLENLCESASSVIQIGLHGMAAAYFLVIITWCAGRVQAADFCHQFCWDPVGCTSSDGPFDGRGLVVLLHALSAACGVGAQMLVACKWDDFLRITLRACQRRVPVLLSWLMNHVPPLQSSIVIKKFSEEIAVLAGEERARRSWANIVASFNRWYPMLLDVNPMLREAAPSASVVKFLVAVQTFSPLLAVTLALDTNVWPNLAVAANRFLSGMILTYCLSNLGPTIPQRKLHRLVLLLPRFYVDRSTRTRLGYVLQNTKRAQDAAQRLMWVPLTLLELPKKLLGW